MNIKNTLKLATLVGLVGLSALNSTVADPLQYAPALQEYRSSEKIKHTTKALHDFMMSRVSNKKTYNHKDHQHKEINLRSSGTHLESCVSTEERA